MIDARGRSCPEPVIMVKKAVASNEATYEVLVDNKVALENITRFCKTAGYSVTSIENGPDIQISLRKQK